MKYQSFPLYLQNNNIGLTYLNNTLTVKYCNNKNKGYIIKYNKICFK